MRQSQIDVIRKINEHFKQEVGDRHDNIRFISLALCGECGELANLIKKEWRGDAGLDVKDVYDEIADIQIYLFHLAELLETNIDDCVAMKLPKLLARWPHIKIG